MDNMNDSRPADGCAASVLVDAAGLSLPDGRAVDVSLRASVVFALRVYNSQILEGQLRQHIVMALTAQTVGQMRRIIAAADRLLVK
jgi:hypothetical protein